MECPDIPITSYSEFSKRLRDEVVSRHIPITGSIEVTARCNLRCAHCYINLPAADRDALERELSCQELSNVLDQIVDEGCLWLLLTGGEPLIRPDFLDIYTYAKKKGMLITLFTNGTTITPRIADHLADWPPFSVEITLYGRTRETYERVTGVPGSYRRCIRGIELLLERRLPLKLKSMVLTLNKHEIWAIKEYAEGLGLEFRFDPVLNMRVDGESESSKKPAKFRISPEEVVQLELADERRVRDWQEFCDRFWGPPPNPEYLYQCGAGVGTFHVDPYGQLSACMMSRVPSYDLRQGTFHEGWYEFIPQVREQKRMRETPCQYCELISLCDQCPGYAQMETGDQETPVQYLCQIAHLRAQNLGLSNRKGKMKHDTRNTGQDSKTTL
jgi:radical SAM protein with 4Fe4S-binding SPASM domain